MTREEYEYKINTSPLFDIDKESDSILYQKERNILLRNIALYYRDYLYKGKELADYDCELMEVAVDCIKSYDKQKGAFVNLLNYSMKKKYNVAVAKRNIDNYRQGITLVDKQEHQIRAIYKLARSKNGDINDLAVQEQIASALNIDLSRVIELIAINNQAVGVDSILINEDGDELCLWDLNNFQQTESQSNLINNDSVLEFFDMLELAFLSLQDRKTTKLVLSLLLTNRIVKEFKDDFDVIQSSLKDKKFCSKEVIEYFNKTGKVLSNKEIALKLNLSTASISRTLNNFLKKVKIKC